jgi:hypothetical protein
MSKARLTYAGGKYAGKKIVDLLKSIKRVARNKKSKANVEKAGQGTKSIKKYNIRAGARDSKIIPSKKQSQKGSSFQTHNVKTPGANSARGMGLSRYGSEGSAASWRSDMDRFQEIPLSAFLKKKRKALGGVASFKKGGDNMPARNKKNFRPTEKGAGMTKAGVAAYRRANPGSKLKTAVTGKVKAGSKAAKRRKSYCARSLGQLKRASAKTRNDPNSRIRQARRRWKC